MLTDVRETDCRSALVRGMREYLEQLGADWAPTRRFLRFERVVENWAESELPATYPAAAVAASGDGSYDREARLSPTAVRTASGATLFLVGEFTTSVTVDVWSFDKRERAGLVALLEDAFAPVDWMAGFRLELPHYHGVRTTWELQGSRYMDVDGADPQQRVWRAQLTLDAKVPQVRLTPARPDMRIRLRTEGKEPTETLVDRPASPGHVQG